MEKYILGFLLVLFVHAGIAQQQEKTQLSQQEKLERLQGTYEVKTAARFIAMPSNLADIITENRDAAKRVIKQLSPETTLIIYSLAEIQSKEKAQEGK